MEILTFTTDIQANPETVWDAMFDEENYKIWSAAFHPGSYYKGTLEQNAEIQLLTPEGHGMFTLVAVYEPFKELTFHHQGEIEDGKKGEIIYENAFESYLLEDFGNSTALTIRMNCEESYVDKMNRMVPDALARVKDIAEKNL